MDDITQASLEEAKRLALETAYPRDKNTKVGCVLETPSGNFSGANIKRWSWNNNTCAERMAIDQALFKGVPELGRFVVYAINQSNPSEEVTPPCGPCRDIIKDGLSSLGQEDVGFVMTNASMTKVVTATLADLLPL